MTVMFDGCPTEIVNSRNWQVVAELVHLKCAVFRNHVTHNANISLTQNQLTFSSHFLKGAWCWLSKFRQQVRCFVHQRLTLCIVHQLPSLCVTNLD